jgi:hypothetical protein
MAVPDPVPLAAPVSLIALSIDRVTWSITLTVSLWIAALMLLLLAGWLTWRWKAGGFSLRHFEIDQAEIGVGNAKLRFKPNLTDRQVAYAVWIELSTRKIGLPIDFEHDIIYEIYDSWYNFFTVTRDLLKGIPVGQVKNQSTQAIIKLSIEVLNEGLRPHLTRWQARFRRWYERELKKTDVSDAEAVIDPQDIQSRFPLYGELRGDMERVNQSLIRYRAKMRELVLTD